MRKLILVWLFVFSLPTYASIDHVVPYESEIIKGQYIVRLQSDMSLYPMADVEAMLQVNVLQLISVASNAILVETKEQGNDKAILANLLSSPIVANAEPNYRVQILSTPNDPEFSKLWGLKNTGSNDPRGRIGKQGVDVNAEAAWDITTGSKDVIVAVIDTGVDARIADLRNNMWVNAAELNGQTGIDDDKNGFVDDIHGYDFVNNDGDPTDDHAHGSHVAGTIAAEGNNGQSIVGVAWNASIMAVKFLSAQGSGSTAGAIAAIDYATQMGAHIMNNSWGGGPLSSELKAAISRANEKNAIFVAAAGNQSSNNDTNNYYPCSYDVANVICVGSLDSDGKLSDFSNYGKSEVDIAAPGRNILSTTPSGLQIFNGTSMATPHVSGALVLLLSKHANLSAAEVRERLMRTARPNYKIKYQVASGMLDAYSLLTNYVYPADPEDPMSWDEMNYVFSSEHPYKDNAKFTQEIEVPGASRFVLYFSKFETEHNYDRLTFKDENGKVIGVWSGDHNGETSPEFLGSKGTIEFSSDRSMNRYGFDITKIYYK